MIESEVVRVESLLMGTHKWAYQLAGPLSQESGLMGTRTWANQSMKTLLLVDKVKLSELAARTSSKLLPLSTC